MSTLANRQINVMMRLKIHFQIIQNLAQVTKLFLILIIPICHKILVLRSSPKNTCSRAIKTIYKYCLKYLQNLCIVDHAANFKQQIVSCHLECLNSERETV